MNRYDEIIKYKISEYVEKIEYPIYRFHNREVPFGYDGWDFNKYKKERIDSYIRDVRSRRK